MAEFLCNRCDNFARLFADKAELSTLSGIDPATAKQTARIEFDEVARCDYPFCLSKVRLEASLVLVRR